ncbi:MAG: hypothetical protein IJ099_00235 [Alphaproteobacteria bacterium]|nr:hypothetical protein [Alphaproteobacteria bacterium]
MTSMTRDEIIMLVERVQNVCPLKCQAEIVPTYQKQETWVVVIQFPTSYFVIDKNQSAKIEQCSEELGKILKKYPELKEAHLWEEQKIHDFHYETILPLLGDAEHFRGLYWCDSKFVLYTHHPCVFNGYSPKNFHFIGTYDNQHYKYIGSHPDVDSLIAYLMDTYDEL